MRVGEDPKGVLDLCRARRHVLLGYGQLPHWNLLASPVTKGLNMIGTEPKTFGEVAAALEGLNALVVIGCGGCAAVCHTGGEPEVAEMRAKLEDLGKTVLGAGVPERTCYIHQTRKVLDSMSAVLRRADAVVVLGCGGAVQTVRQATEERGLVLPIVSTLNSMGHMDTIIPDALWMERCSECGDCVLNETGGICPVTLCAKGLRNGPCGGTRADGKCEADPEKDCAWHLIYERLKALGQLEKMRTIRPPRDWSKTARPRKIVYRPVSEAMRGAEQ
jgi:ferredoxin